MAYVITDAGPLIALAKVDALLVPRDLFSRIRIPEAVWFEYRAKPGEDSRRLEQAADEGWLEVVSVSTAPVFYRAKRRSTKGTFGGNASAARTQRAD